MIFTKKKRKELAELKWELIVEENFTYYEFRDYIDATPKPEYEELRDLDAHCSFCEEFGDNDCMGCTLNKKEYEYEDDEKGYVKGTCTSPNHPWMKWSDEKDDKKRLEYAKTILNIIKEY